jgi:hypothetical protein
MLLTWLPVLVFIASYTILCGIGSLLLLYKIEPFFSVYQQHTGVILPLLTGDEHSIFLNILFGGPICLAIGYGLALPLLRRWKPHLKLSTDLEFSPLIANALYYSFFFSAIHSLIAAGAFSRIYAWANYAEWVNARWNLFNNLSFFEFVNIYMWLPTLSVLVLLVKSKSILAKVVRWIPMLLTIGLDLLLYQKKPVILTVMVCFGGFWIRKLLQDPNKAARSMFVASVSISSGIAFYVLVVLAPYLGTNWQISVPTHVTDNTETQAKIAASLGFQTKRDEEKTNKIKNKEVTLATNATSSNKVASDATNNLISTNTKDDLVPALNKKTSDKINKNNLSRDRHHDSKSAKKAQPNKVTKVKTVSKVSKSSKTSSTKVKAHAKTAAHDSKAAKASSSKSKAQVKTTANTSKTTKALSPTVMAQAKTAIDAPRSFDDSLAKQAPAISSIEPMPANQPKYELSPVEYALFTLIARSPGPALFFPVVFPKQAPYYRIDIGLDIIGFGTMPDENRLIWRAMYPNQAGGATAPINFVFYSQGGLPVVFIGMMIVGILMALTWSTLLNSTGGINARSIFGITLLVYSIHLTIDSLRNTTVVSYGFIWAGLLIVALYFATWVLKGKRIESINNS